MNILLFIIIIILLQLLIGHLWHKAGMSRGVAIILCCLPLGTGLFLMQLFYYERRYPHWELDKAKKLPLKYIYLLTFVEFVALYICIFKM